MDLDFDEIDENKGKDKGEEAEKPSPSPSLPDKKTEKTEKADTTYSLKNFTILLVDDYEFMRNIITSMLRALGIGNILVCSSGKEAINLLTITEASQRNAAVKGIDLIIADWLMPDGSGQDLIKWVRNHKSDKIHFTPIMMISAYASKKTIIAARDFGANESMVKPVSGKKLSKHILSIIDNPRPFVKTPDFFGPDRRRKEKPFLGEDKRTMNTDDIEAHHERV